ncbi:MAG: hypothetical protein U5L45_22095 [Saprospiraceae bacterium]|nr:hypothetical protein [Saprospiraceae bacterium]
MRAQRHEKRRFIFRQSRKMNRIILARAKRARDAKNAFRLCPSLD